MPQSGDARTRSNFGPDAEGVVRVLFRPGTVGLLVFLEALVRKNIETSMLEDVMGRPRRRSRARKR